MSHMSIVMLLEIYGKVVASVFYGILPTCLIE